jgi:hypothetical protein
MLPRALLVLLAVMNLGVALWWATHSTAPAASPGVDLPAGVPELRLLSEAGGAPPAPAPRCHRFGPYGDPATLAAAREAAGAFGSPVDIVTLPGTAPDTWRVAAPPPRDGDSAALATRIAAAGFDDYMLVAEGAEAGSVALGRFGTPEAAARRAQALRDAGFDAQVHPVGGNSDWLHVSLPPGMPVADARALLQALQAGPVPCEDGR